MLPPKLRLRIVVLVDGDESLRGDAPLGDAPLGEVGARLGESSPLSILEPLENNFEPRLVADPRLFIPGGSASWLSWLLLDLLRSLGVLMDSAGPEMPPSFSPLEAVPQGPSSVSVPSEACS